MNHNESRFDLIAASKPFMSKKQRKYIILDYLLLNGFLKQWNIFIFKMLIASPNKTIV